MRNSYKQLCKSFNFRFTCSNWLNKNKLLFLSLCFICILGILTGIFVAFRCGITTATLSDFNLDIYVCNEGNFFSNFLSRFFSCIINISILAICSLYVLLIPIGYVVIGYRGYLVGFNCALLISLFGISGTISSVLVILPCQIIISLILIVYFIIMINSSAQKKKFGSSGIKFFKTTLLFISLLAIICLIESILLTLFSASTILVI